MSDMDFSDLGKEIEEKVKRFVHSQEMKDLQENIRITVGNTMKEVQRSAKEAAEYINQNVDIRWEGSPKRRLPLVKNPPGRILGGLLSFVGGIASVIAWAVVLTGFGITFMGSSIMGSVLQMFFDAAFVESLALGMNSFGVVSFGMVAVIGTFCTITAVLGGTMRRRAKRFKSYVKKIGKKEVYSIKELAEATEKSEKYVLKDLKNMTRRRWFQEGHFDEQETCFILTDETYQIYLDTQEKIKKQKEEEERQRKEAEILEQDPLRKQLKITIEEGKEYIRRIHLINDKIPGEDISEKLYRLEQVCRKIFEYIEEKPEQLTDIRKFMNYYLPTTLKLVEAYYEFSIQPVRGENITAAQKEIEEMLDQINQAFEKMYDKLFQDSAMDISTDISVLSTMLAQEGLLDSEFK